MKKIVLITAALFLVAGTALAAPVVDFASSAFSGVHNQTSATVNFGGVGYTFTAYPLGAKLTWNPGPAGGIDGIGIDSGWLDQTLGSNDEITGKIKDNELLQVDFSKPLYVTGIHITNLFYENGYQEEGLYKLHYASGAWSDWIPFLALISQTPSSSNGELYIALSPANLLGIKFTTPDYCQFWLDPRNDFSVRGINVPEPATMLLLGCGLIGMAAFGRRKFIR